MLYYRPSKISSLFPFSLLLEWPRIQEALEESLFRCTFAKVMLLVLNFVGMILSFFFVNVIHSLLAHNYIAARGSFYQVSNSDDMISYIIELILFAFYCSPAHRGTASSDLDFGALNSRFWCRSHSESRRLIWLYRLG
jgi:hypothetical protein